MANKHLDYINYESYPIASTQILSHKASFLYFVHAGRSPTRWTDQITRAISGSLHVAYREDSCKKKNNEMRCVI